MKSNGCFKNCLEPIKPISLSTQIIHFHFLVYLISEFSAAYLEFRTCLWSTLVQTTFWPPNLDLQISTPSYGFFWLGSLCYLSQNSQLQSPTLGKPMAKISSYCNLPLVQPEKHKQSQLENRLIKIVTIVTYIIFKREIIHI